MRRLSRAFMRVVLVLGAACAWALVYHLIVIRDVGHVAGFWAPTRLAAYAAFVLAPGLTFVPIARALRIPLYDLEAIAAWSTLAFLVAFIDPGTQPPLPVLLVLLVSLVMALATIFTLLSYAIGLRLFARRRQRYDFIRARREGYLASIFLVGLLLLSMLDALSRINAALLGLIVFLIEVFLLSRGGSSARELPEEERFERVGRARRSTQES
jgi:hypothetical protein